MQPNERNIKSNKRVAYHATPTNNYEIKKIKQNSAITLIALVITIIVLLILAGLTLTFVLGENGIISKSKNAKEETRKSTATETMNLKITNVEMSKYVEKQRMPTLKEMADDFCEDNDFEYVHETRRNASLTKINNENPDSIYTKLKAYPYEFEINSSLQLASIDGVQIASNNNTSGDYVSRAQYDSLLARVVAIENTSNSSYKKDYSTNEMEIGTWLNGEKLFRRTYEFDISFSTTEKTEERSANLSEADKIVKLDTIGYDGTYQQVPYSRGNARDEYIFAYYDSGSDKFRIVGKNVTGMSKIYITVEYTKKQNQQ